MSNQGAQHFRWPVIGHSNIVAYLQNNITNDQVSHAYLFVGPDHTGKKTVADYFVNSLICAVGNNDQAAIRPCGECQHCRQFKNGIHPDIFNVDREINDKTGRLKKNISIEQVRELQDRLNLHSFLNSYKVGIINAAQTLSLEAANSLLKTLEEPSPQTVMIIIVNHLSQLPRTLVSRCQVINFLPVGTKAITDYLISQKIDRKQARNLGSLAFGLPGLAINYYHDSQQYELLRERSRELVAILGANLTARFKLVGDLLTGLEVDSIQLLLNNWLKTLRDVLLIKCGANHLISQPFLAGELSQVAINYQTEKIMAMIKEIEEAKKMLSANVNNKLTIENLVLNF